MKHLFCTMLSFLYVSVSLGADQLPGTKYFVVKDSGKSIDFMNWKTYNEPAPMPPEKYVRKKHFGVWINFPDDDTCLTTRGLVLERDTLEALKVYDEHPCTVEAGLWHDNYTDEDYTDAKQIEIDHVVPLKNAYLSGAYEWPWSKRCAYFNFMGNPFHLVPIEEHANTAKLDRGPDKWMPPNENYHCQYLSNWMRVKTIWGLRLSEPEGESIRQQVKDLQCEASLFRMSKAELNQQRKFAEHVGGDLCPAHAPGEAATDL